MSVFLNVLAVESSTSACSVSLLTEVKQSSRFELAPQKHADLMLPMVESVMAEQAIEANSIDLIAFSNGPGAFTGIRIATGVAQGLALGWDKPVIGISPLEAMGFEVLQSLPEGQKVLVCLDARMKEIYAQLCWFEGGEFFSEAVSMQSESELRVEIEQTCLKQDDALPLVGAGDIEKDYPELVDLFDRWQTILPKASHLAKIAATRYKQARLVDEVVPMPVYLRNNVAEKTVDREKRKGIKA